MANGTEPEPLSSFVIVLNNWEGEVDKGIFSFFSFFILFYLIISMKKSK